MSEALTKKLSELHEQFQPHLENLHAQTRAHHPYSPSTLQAREACPKYQPRNSESAASLAGTRQHDSAEHGIDNPHLTDAEAFAVVQCVEYTGGLAKKYPGGTILKEPYLPVDDEHTTAGYADFVVVSADGKTAEIADYKYGKFKVAEASENLQGIAYLLGVKHLYPQLETGVVHFVCPHQDFIDRHEFFLTGDTADKMLLRVRTVVARAKLAATNPADFSAAVPSASTCLFCGLIAQCPRVTEYVLRVSQKFAPLEIPAEINPTLILDPEDASLGIRLAQVAEVWSKAFRARATEKTIVDPNFCPVGYKLVTMSRRSVVDARKVIEVGKGFLPADKAEAVDALIDVPLGAVEKLIEAATPRGKKKAAVEAFGEAIEKAGAVKTGLPFGILKMDTEK